MYVQSIQKPSGSFSRSANTNDQYDTSRAVWDGEVDHLQATAAYLLAGKTYGILRIWVGVPVEPNALDTAWKDEIPRIQLVIVLQHTII